MNEQRLDVLIMTLLACVITFAFCGVIAGIILLIQGAQSPTSPMFATLAMGISFGFGYWMGNAKIMPELYDMFATRIKEGGIL
jgi:hypothetical protein